jgi:hypothetical protein
MKVSKKIESIKRIMKIGKIYKVKKKTNKLINYGKEFFNFSFLIIYCLLLYCNININFINNEIITKLIFTFFLLFMIEENYRFYGFL